MPADKKSKKRTSVLLTDHGRRLCACLSKSLRGGLLVLVLASCATTSQSVVYTRDAVLKGDVSLSCVSFICANRWRSERGGLSELYQSGAWEQLASQVSKLQYDHDLAYFYLGTAALELGSPSAAKQYFDRGGVAANQCNIGIFNDCGGISIAAEIRRQNEGFNKSLAAFLDQPMQLSEVQARLNQLGLYTAAIDGIAGPRTKGALEQFQASRGLSATGSVDPETMLSLTRSTRMPQAIPRRAAIPPAKKAAPPSANKPAPLSADKPDTGNKPALLTAEKTKPGPMEVSSNDKPILADSSETAPLQVPAEQPLPLVVEATDDALKAEATSVAVAAATGSFTEASIPVAEDSAESPATDVQGVLRSAPAVDAGKKSRVIVEVEILRDADPFADVAAVVPRGSWVTIIDRGSEWSKVSYGDDIGYVYTDILQ